jgi:1-deoxy-D-xylulose-5-phosphate reductoisomerase
MPAILNAANEVAVQAFLDRRIGFTDIPRVIEHALANLPASRETHLDAVLSDDRRARDVAGDFIATPAPRVKQGVT